MHAIVISPYPLQSTILLNALKRQNIYCLSMSPENLGCGWEPRSNAVIIYHPLPLASWQKIRGFLLNLHRKVPLILVGKIHQHIFNQAGFKQLIKKTIQIDDEVSLDDIPFLIKECLERHSYGVEDIYIGKGEYILDRKNRMMIFKGTKIQLTKKEFFLMELLINNNGQITTREEIMEYVWDRGKFVAPNTIEVYISRLRKKIDNESKNSLISTVPCLGYQFVKM